MKTCMICGANAPTEAQTCVNDGEASWSESAPPGVAIPETPAAAVDSQPEIQPSTIALGAERAVDAVAAEGSASAEEAPPTIDVLPVESVEPAMVDPDIEPSPSVEVLDVSAVDAVVGDDGAPVHPEPASPAAEPEASSGETLIDLGPAVFAEPAREVTMIGGVEVDPNSVVAPAGE